MGDAVSESIPMHVSADLSQWRVSEINEADVTGFSQIRSTANSLLDNRITTAELVTQIIYLLQSICEISHFT